MEVGVLNGNFNTVEPMNGFNSVIPMNGFNSVVPMNGSTARTMPLNGARNRVWYVAPVSLMDINDVPSDWIPTGLTDDQIMFLKTAYIMGDNEALNGFGDRIRSAVQRVADRVGDINILGTNVGQTFDEVILPTAKDVGTVAMKAAQVVVPAVLSATGVGTPAAAAAAVGIAAINKKIASDQAAKQAAQAGLSPSQQAQAAEIAGQSQEALAKIGINANPGVVADRAVMAIDAGGVKSSTGSFSISEWWNARSTTEKTLWVGGTILVVGGTIYYFSTRKKKGGKK